MCLFPASRWPRAWVGQWWQQVDSVPPGEPGAGGQAGTLKTGGAGGTGGLGGEGDELRKTSQLDAPETGARVPEAQKLQWRQRWGSLSSPGPAGHCGGTGDPIMASTLLAPVTVSLLLGNGA